MTEVDFDLIEQRNLQKLIEMEKPDPFPLSFIKRYLLLGEDRAISLAERGITEGKLVKVTPEGSWEDYFHLADNR